MVWHDIVQAEGCCTAVPRATNESTTNRQTTINSLQSTRREAQADKYGPPDCSLVRA